MKLAAIFLVGIGMGMPALGGSTGNVRVEILVVRVPHDAGLQLREKLRNKQTVVRAVAELKEKVARGDAELVGAPVLWSTNGSRVSSDTTQELRHPTERDPTSPPQNFGIPTWRPPSDSARTNWLKNLVQQFIAVPLAYETRNIGLSVELEATPNADSRNISIAMVVTSSSLTGYRRILSGLNQRGDNTYSQPEFRSHQSTSMFETTSGLWRLTGVSVIPGKTPSMELMALRASIVP